VAVAPVNESGAVFDAVPWSTVPRQKKPVDSSSQAPKVGSDNPMRRVMVSLGDRPVVFVAEMLRVRSVLSAAKGALRWLEEAAVQADGGGARRTRREEISLDQVKSETRDHRVYRVSGQPRSAS
jgi:hypothetical protein